MLAALAFTLLYASATYGWGKVSRGLTKSEPSPFAQMAEGLALLIILGGILNLFRIAYPITVFAIIATGVFITLFDFIQKRSQRFDLDRNQLILYAAALIFFLLIGLPLGEPSAFNFHDDLEKYFKHPARMLAYGSLSSGGFDTIGYETLGGQAFLHSFSFVFTGHQHLNVFDSCFCFFLFLGLAIEASRGSGNKSLTIGLTCISAAILFPPFQVNTSSVYSSASLCLLILNQSIRKNDEPATLLSVYLLGMPIAALLALKVSNAFFVPFIGIAIFCISLSTRNKTSDSCIHLLTIAGLSFLFISPWLATHFDFDWRQFQTTDPLIFSPQTRATFEHLLSENENIYAYGLPFRTLSIFAFITLAISIFCFFKRPNHIKPITLFGFFGVLSYIASLTIITNHLSGPLDAARYAFPILAAATVTTTAALSNSPRPSPKSYSLTLLYFAAIAIAFAAPSWKRIAQTYQSGNALAFHWLSTSEKYLGYMAFILGDATRNETKTFQDQFPSNAKLLVWSQMAHNWDYSRNRIVALDPAGLSSLQTSFTYDGDPEKMLGKLRKRGFRYIIWQNAGLAARTLDSMPVNELHQYPATNKVSYHTRHMISFLKDLRQREELRFIENPNLALVSFKIPDPTES